MRIELGCRGHFIAASACRFWRHTQVEHYRVSTVGDLYFRHAPEVRQALGADPDSWFETMVFRTAKEPAKGSSGCGCREVSSWSEVACQRYATAGEAQAGHEALVAKYEGQP